MKWFCGLMWEIKWWSCFDFFFKKIQHHVVIDKTSMRGNWCDLISEIKSDKTSVRGNWCDLISKIKREAIAEI